MEIKINRADLIAYESPTDIVNAIIRLVPDLPIPVPIDELALRLDIIGIRSLDAEGFEGGLITDIDKSEGLILVNKASILQRRRFTIGHELGHFLCPSHMPIGDSGFRCSSDDMRLSSSSGLGRTAHMEAEANLFAAHLLMPQFHFSKDMSLYKDVNIEHILDLATRYDASREATARRYIDLLDEPCAVIVSYNGTILRFYRGEGFPYLYIKRGDLLPQKSITYGIDLNKGEISEWEELDGSIWLSLDRRRRGPIVKEQVLHQSEGYHLTLLKLKDDME